MQSSASLPALARGASRGSARDGPASRIGTPAFKSRPMTVAFAGSPAGNVPLFLSPPVVRLSSVQRTGRSVEAAAHAAAKAAQTSPAMCSVPNDLAWDHAPRSLARHAARGEVRVLAPSMAEWVTSLDTDAARFRDPLLQLEASLRLWLTTAAPPPHPLRTAAVCEVLARLPEVCVPAAPLLQLLRSELSRALYASYALAEGTGMTLDGNGLLAIEAFHQRATRLEGELEEVRPTNAGSVWPQQAKFGPSQAQVANPKLGLPETGLVWPSQARFGHRRLGWPAPRSVGPPTSLPDPPPPLPHRPLAQTCSCTLTTGSWHHWPPRPTSASTML